MAGQSVVYVVVNALTLQGNSIEPRLVTVPSDLIRERRHARNARAGGGVPRWDGAPQAGSYSKRKSRRCSIVPYGAGFV